jgi:N-acyl-D-amino-acid deacylase
LVKITFWENEMTIRRSVPRFFAMSALAAASMSATALAGVDAGVHDVVIRNAMIYDGSGNKPYPGDLSIDGDRISYVGPHRALKGRTEIDAHGQAVAPGFIDMMGHSEEALLIDGRSVSGLKQGVTLDIFDEMSMGPRWHGAWPSARATRNSR